jgi:hypothetical protein
MEKAVEEEALHGLRSAFDGFGQFIPACRLFFLDFAAERA